LPDGKKIRWPVGSICGKRNVPQPPVTSVLSRIARIESGTSWRELVIGRHSRTESSEHLHPWQTYHAVWQAVAIFQHALMRKRITGGAVMTAIPVATLPDIPQFVIMARRIAPAGKRGGGFFPACMAYGYAANGSFGGLR
jgi:hypothetical protein